LLFVEIKKKVDRKSTKIVYECLNFENS